MGIFELWGDIGVTPAIKPDPQPWVDNEIHTGTYQHPNAARTKERVKQTSEIFTPMELVEAMLDGLTNARWGDPEYTAADPCGFGDGQFIVGMLRRKLIAGLTPLQAVKSTYGIELLQDNVDITRQRVLNMVGDTPEIRAVINFNLACGNALEFDYDNWRPMTKDEVIARDKAERKEKRAAALAKRKSNLK